MTFLIALGIIIASGGILVVALNFWEMYRSPDFHGWPGITRCRICEKRVFVWNRRERRAFQVEIDNPHNLLARVSASGIVHRSCQGNPVCKVSVRAHAHSYIH